MDFNVQIPLPDELVFGTLVCYSDDETPCGDDIYMVLGQCTEKTNIIFSLHYTTEPSVPVTTDTILLAQLVRETGRIAQADRKWLKSWHTHE